MDLIVWQAERAMLSRRNCVARPMGCLLMRFVLCHEIPRSARICGRGHSYRTAGCSQSASLERRVRNVPRDQERRVTEDESPHWSQGVVNATH